MREPEDGERLVVDGGGQCIYSSELRTWRIYDSAGRYRGARDNEQEAEALAERCATGEEHG
jgi:hypothetical protein